MSEQNNLRALIRLLPPTRALKSQLEQSLHMETFAGTGDAAIKMLGGLQQSIARLTDDPYVAVLAPTVPEGADDQQKVSLAMLGAGQLLAFIEGETGLVGFSGGSGSGGGDYEIHIQKAPSINLNNVSGVPGIEKVLDVLKVPTSEV